MPVNLVPRQLVQEGVPSAAIFVTNVSPAATSVRFPKAARHHRL
jgi:hypothetical protein